MSSPETALPWLDKLLANTDFVKELVEVLKKNDVNFRVELTPLSLYTDILDYAWGQPNVDLQPLKRLVTHLLDWSFLPNRDNLRRYYSMLDILEIASRYGFESPLFEMLDSWFPRLINQHSRILEFLTAQFKRSQNPQIRNYIKANYLIPLLDSAEPPPNLDHERGIISLVTAPIDEELRQLALQRLTRFSTEFCREIAQNWYYSRRPEFETLLLKLDWTNLPSVPYLRRSVVFLALKTNRLNEFQFEPLDSYYLMDAIEDHDNTIVANAQAMIDGLTESDLNIIADHCAFRDVSSMLRILTLRNYFPSPGVLSFDAYLLLGLKLNHLDELISLNGEQVQFLINALNSYNHEVAERAYQLAGQLTDTGAQAALCEAVIETNWPDLERVVKKAGFAPLELPRKALFYFLTEQWEAYERLDFDHSILRAQYQAASSVFKKRLIAKIRVAGRAEYLDILKTGTSGLEPPGQTFINGSEVSVLVGLLEQQGQWAQLWSLVGLVMLSHSRQIVQKLQQVGWQPATENERALLAELAKLVAGPMEIGLSKVRRLLTAEQWSDLDWAGWLAQPLGKRGPADLTALLTFRAKGWRLPGELQATLTYLETLLRYRLLYSIELVEESAEPGEFDIEL